MAAAATGSPGLALVPPRPGVPAADLCIVGPLDVTTVARVRADLAQLLVADGAAADLVLDLTKLAALDLVGLGMLVGIHRQARHLGRRLVLVGVQPRILRVLAVTRLGRILRIVETAPATTPTSLIDLSDQAAHAV
jgi:anti-sigma B factor antagonist